jgi:hypothetical protein
VGCADRDRERGLQAVIDSHPMAGDALHNWLAYKPIELFAVQVE